MRILTLSIMLALVSSVAEAKIRCKGPYQIVKGNYIATPWCEDNYLARIARSYGVRVTNRQIRNNPNKKERVCHFMGHDIRVQQICSQYTVSYSRGRF